MSVQIRVCPDCGVRHQAHRRHECLKTGRIWCPGDDERAAEAAAKAEAERLAALKPKSRAGRPAAGKAEFTIERRKPWEREGMSRATWYRRLARGEVSRFDDSLD